ncbi:HtaA protein [Corynebacterium felinum]|uniref:HtaA protein n=1 Tax=Corynebacterium felinum TaxID=131318 RepID=A0ABU2B6L1_9CORY|nr:HtaA protein [Corynebacterium felinum]MDF5819623.1 HtaA protein [Corynebacterium felinum]MDR7354245.1 hypothetical protein [Corynebacterium felinum]WJY96413.1 hypothetical protein CFELI_14210 [Corynebacterium felinum]
MNIMPFFTAVTVCGVIVGLAPQASSIPVIDDHHPALPPASVPAHVVQPRVTVTDEQGRTLSGPVRRGDTLIVYGTGFDPQANRGGFLFPVPPGVPNGVFVLYSALPEHWKPSQGAPPSARVHPHDRMAWVMPAGTLESIPTAPIDMRRSIARVAQPMADNGSFVARVVVDPPEKTPGDRWGIYVYAGAGSINAAEEIFIPIPFDPSPGANTVPTRPDLLVDAHSIAALTRTLGGGVNAKNGAAMHGGMISFTKAADAGDGVLRFSGMVIMTARFSAVEVAVADPWLRPVAGGFELSALVSQSPTVGPDQMQRQVLGTVAGISGDQVLKNGSVEVAKLKFNHGS